MRLIKKPWSVSQKNMNKERQPWLKKKWQFITQRFTTSDTIYCNFQNLNRWSVFQRKVGQS